MENGLDLTLKRIIETDKISREKVNEKKQRLLSLDTEITEYKNAVDEELYEQSKKNIEKQKKTAEIKLREEISRIDAFYADAEDKLRASFEDRRDEFSEKLFRKITE